MDKEAIKKLVDAWWEKHFAPSAPSFGAAYTVVREKKELLKKMIDDLQEEE